MRGHKLRTVCDQPAEIGLQRDRIRQNFGIGTEGVLRRNIAETLADFLRKRILHLSIVENIRFAFGH